MNKQEIRQLVNEVADLVCKFFSVQNYSGEGDTIPHRIARALKEGSLNCPRCCGSGLVWRSQCSMCDGNGRIPFTVEALREERP